jgi:hypothetical protein
VKTFNIFVVAWDGQLNSRMFEVGALDEQLAVASAEEALLQIWPDATQTTMIIAQQRMCLDMLEPSMN